ncbi:hypothetical protein Esti_004443 [Eimeria stiedai]
MRSIAENAPLASCWLRRTVKNALMAITSILFATLWFAPFDDLNVHSCAMIRAWSSCVANFGDAYERGCLLNLRSAGKVMDTLFAMCLRAPQQYRSGVDRRTSYNESFMS